MKSRLFLFLMFAICLNLILIVQVKAANPFIWRDDFNYSSTSQLEAAGWQITQNPSGVTLVNGTVVLDGTKGDTAIAYTGHFPSGITDWKVEDRSMWLGKGHAGTGVAVALMGHNYGWAGDGWYSDFAFYRDNLKVMTFGKYQEQANVWVTMTMEKRGNKINLYYNGQLEKTYNETDQSVVGAQVQGVSLISPWEGNQAFDNYKVESLGTSTDMSSWDSFSHDNANTRVSPSIGPRTNKVLWNFTAANPVRTSAAVVDGVVYEGTFGGNFYAINAKTGTQIWSFKTDTDIWASPTVANGVVYVGANSGTLFALSTSSGQKIWEFKTGSGLYNGPTIVGNVVYEASTDGNLYALDATTGTEIWRFNTGGQSRSSPAVVGGVVYIGSMGGGKIYAVDAVKGSELWSFTVTAGNSFMDSSTAVVDGVVYIGSMDSNVYALDAKTGVKVWSYTTGGKVSSSPAVVGGVVYVGSEDGNLYALQAATGAKIWSYSPGGPVYSSPSIANGVVYIGSWNGAIDAIDASNGEVIWTYPMGKVFASPAIANNVVYVGDYNNKVYAFGTPGTNQQTNQTKPPVFVGGVVNGTTVASNKVTMKIQTPSSNTTHYEVRVDGGKWVNVGLSNSYTFSGLSLGKHVLEGQAVTSSGQVTGSSNVSVTVSVWVPPATNAVASSVVTAGIIGAVSLVAYAASNPASFAGNWLLDKFNKLIPKYVKDWLESFFSSKRSQVIENRTGSIFVLTKLEVIAYAVTLIILTFAFSYSGAGSWGEFLVLIPTVFVTGVAVGLIKTLLMEMVARFLGVWSEHRLWYLGLATFTFSTLVFKAPFSSPSRVLHYSPNSTKKTTGLSSTISMMITLCFAALFYAVMAFGFPTLGSIGLASCLLGALFSIIPIPLMSGRDIWNWNKLIWVALFLVSAILYALWLLYL